MVPVQRKVVVVGDTTCGKTCLLTVFARDKLPREYVPTIFDTFTRDLTIGGRGMKLTLWDTAGQQDYDRLRPLCYPSTDAFILCFAVDRPDTFITLPEKWIPEIRHFCPKVPIVLVGTKKDLRNDAVTIDYLAKRRMKPVSTAEGRSMAEKVGAFAYIECSAFNNGGVREVFETAVCASQFSKEQRLKQTNVKPKCDIL